MSPPNGHANCSPGIDPHSTAPVLSPGWNSATHYTAEQIKEFVALLEVPFDPGVIEWRVTNTAHDKARGQVMPYADQRAYTDRLNALFTPAGWTRKYTVHTSANFERSKDKKVVAKIVVTCEVTIHGFGSHSATGEEWADDENSATSAEAQAFKRACSCFGLGRYLYHFTGVWVDLDERKRPRQLPQLFGWATPDGWRSGLRPTATPAPEAPQKHRHNQADNNRQSGEGRGGRSGDLVRQIEALAEPLGRGMYRGFLKRLAKAWEPSQIKDPALLEKVLTHMQAAQRGLARLDAVLDKIGPNPLGPILDGLGLKSLDQVDDLETLRQIVMAMEDKLNSSAM